MNNNEANNNTPNNARGGGRGRGYRRGGRRGRHRHSGTFVFVDPTFQHNTMPVNNSNALSKNNNTDQTSARPPRPTFVLHPLLPTSEPHPPPPTSAPAPLRSTGTSRNNRTSEEHIALTRQLGVDMMHRMAAVASRNRETASEDLQTKRRQESRDKYRLLEESTSRREANLKEHRRKRMSDMETIMSRFAAIRRGDSDTITDGSYSTDNNN
ncbi:uncharacterized protein EV154DRAFT_572415 [Mucor mucedo]|uniref:uncharacterized protein n=1 Tax=Mucor mucedo TaxID=29922 RepID=UPI0022204BB6|nr:uncharacterized protein EV154DRAFT_572415 [Mucor mucedo]KAI7864636.1 hypothetical protein EV154DRAFT_572415 [Mucor mucedo]